jgi:hypothetical protein
MLHPKTNSPVTFCPIILEPMKSMMKFCLPLLALLLAGCVNVDPVSGKTIPQGNQRYEFATVERRAEQLQVGMTRSDVMMLLGTPAEQSDDGVIWIYLPERPAVLVPSRALRLEFEGGILKAHAYTTIVLGKPL